MSSNQKYKNKENKQKKSDLAWNKRTASVYDNVKKMSGVNKPGVSLNMCDGTDHRKIKTSPNENG